MIISEDLSTRTKREYLACKRKLFLQSREAVVNADDPVWKQMLAGTGCPFQTFGIRNGDFRAVKIRTESFVQGHPGVEFDIGKVHFQIPAPGIFTVYNALAAVRVLYAVRRDAGDGSRIPS